MIFAAPLTLLSVAAGYLFIIRPMGTTGSNSESRVSWQGIKEFIYEMMPITIIISSIIIITGLSGVLTLINPDVNIPSLVSVIVGISGAIALGLPLKRDCTLRPSFGNPRQVKSDNDFSHHIHNAF